MGNLFSSAIVNPKKIKADDFVVLVVGPPGTGKSRFVQTAAQNTRIPIHHEICSDGTQKITAVMCTPKISKQRVVLVDTPAYPSSIGEQTINFKIKDWLGDNTNVKVNGIIYLHDIRMKRVDEVVRPEIIVKKLRESCGAGGGMNVAPAVLVTTMWGQLQTDDVCAQANSRLEVLKNHWNGAGTQPSVIKYKENIEDAWNIVKNVLGNIDLLA